MRFEEVTPAAEMEHRNGGLHYRRANKRNWFAVAFLLVWLGAWTVGGTMAGGMLLTDAPISGKLFLIFWLGAWALGWLAVTSAVLWMAVGSESVTVSRLAFTHTLHLGPLKYDRHYRPSDLSGFYWQAGTEQPAFVGRREARPAAIVATFGARTFEMLRGIQRSEATQLIGKFRPALGLRKAEE